MSWSDVANRFVFQWLSAFFVSSENIFKKVLDGGVGNVTFGVLKVQATKQHTWRTTKQ